MCEHEASPSTSFITFAQYLPRHGAPLDFAQVYYQERACMYEYAILGRRPSSCNGTGTGLAGVAVPLVLRGRRKVVSSYRLVRIVDFGAGAHGAESPGTAAAPRGDQDGDDHDGMRADVELGRGSQRAQGSAVRPFGFATLSPVVEKAGSSLGSRSVIGARGWWSGSIGRLEASAASPQWSFARRPSVPSAAEPGAALLYSLHPPEEKRPARRARLPPSLEARAPRES